MPLVKFVTVDGAVREVDAVAGNSLMQAAIDNGVDEIVAECGGACSCATCHCYVDEGWVGRVPAADSIEQSMLDCVLEPRDNSRLSCQITLTDDMDGIVIHLPAAQY